MWADLGLRSQLFSLFLADRGPCAPMCPGLSHGSLDMLSGDVGSGLRFLVPTCPAWWPQVEPVGSTLTSMGRTPGDHYCDMCGTLAVSRDQLIAITTMPGSGYAESVVPANAADRGPPSGAVLFGIC